jgi:hypothetical protein
MRGKRHDLDGLEAKLPLSLVPSSEVVRFRKWALLIPLLVHRKFDLLTAYCLILMEQS